MAEMNVGDTVRVKAGMYRRPHPAGYKGALFMRGQEIELAEEDVERPDFDLIFEPLDAEEQRRQAQEEAEQEAMEEWQERQGLQDADVSDGPSVPIEDAPDEVTLEALSHTLVNMDVPKAKRWLSSDQWTADGMEMALKAEEDTQNRSSLVKFIKGRLGDLEAEEAEGTP